MLDSLLLELTLPNGPQESASLLQQQSSSSPSTNLVNAILQVRLQRVFEAHDKLILELDRLGQVANQGVGIHSSSSVALRILENLFEMLTG